MRKFLQHKKTRRNLSLFFIGTFAFHFLLLHGELSGYVLCIGSDGHVAVERSVDDTTCSDTEIPPHLEVTSEHNKNCCALDTNHCGDCRDISLTSDCQDEQARNPQRLVDIQPIQSLVISASLSNPGGNEYGHQNPTLTYHTSYHLSLASLRSTVLLI